MDDPGSLIPRGASVAHLASLACVWLAVAAGAVVFSEPAPVDLLMAGLVVLLPVVGLVRFTPHIVGLGALLLSLGALALIAAIDSVYQTKALIHTAVSFYLYAATLVMVAFVAKSPERHTRLILHAYVAAALLAAVAGLVGYFGLVPGGRELFTRFGRASGTFKDPNVFGAFLGPAILVTMHLTFERHGWRRLLAAAGTAFLSIACLLSFSRGAWFNLVLGALAYAGLRLATASSLREQVRLVRIGIAGGVLIALLGIAILQVEAVAELLEVRASLTQSYDVGPDGRFGGQVKAVGLALQYPFGLGAQQFAALYHHEEPHNVYLNMVLNAGWLGGLGFLVLVLATLAVGLVQALRPSPTRPVAIIAWAAFLAHAIEGLIIDLDHWRHFYLLIALIWGLAAADAIPAPDGKRRRGARLVPADVAEPAPVRVRAGFRRPTGDARSSASRVSSS
jgi:hypothetical protein